MNLPPPKEGVVGAPGLGSCTHTPKKHKGTAQSHTGATNKTTGHKPATKPKNPKTKTKSTNQRPSHGWLRDTMAKLGRTVSLGHTISGNGHMDKVHRSHEVEKPNGLTLVPDGYPMKTTGGKPLPGDPRAQMRKPHVGAHTQLLNREGGTRIRRSSSVGMGIKRQRAA